MNSTHIARSPLLARQCAHHLAEADRPCGATEDTRPYLVGPRCPKHTPAAIAGHPEPPTPTPPGRTNPPTTTTELENPAVTDQPRTLLAAALAYAQRGWYVFPLRPGDKRPAFPDHDAEHCTGSEYRCRAAGRHVCWEERATTDPERIHRAWSIAPFNIGIACGPSGLVVIDLDMPHPGKETPPPAWAAEGARTGTDVFAVICARAGQPVPTDTCTVTTGRRGTHLYYQHPATEPRLRNTAGEHGNGLGWLVDTRAHGGYVVAPPSVVDGRAYTVTSDTQPAGLPAWLTERLAPQPLAPPGPTTIELGTGRRAAYLHAAIERTLTHLAQTREGGRNHALYMAAQTLGQLAAGGAITTDAVTAVLAEAAEGIGLRPGEAARTITSGLRAGATRPRRLTTIPRTTQPAPPALEAA